MKKYIYMLLLILVGVNAMEAQRMVPRQKGVQVSAGTLSDENSGRDYYLHIGMTVNGKKGNYQLWALEYSHQYHTYTNLHIPRETYIAQGGYSFCLLADAHKNITLNTAVTGVLGYESINRAIPLLYDGAKIISGDNFIYGVGGQLSFETYLSDRFVLLLQGRTKVLWGTDMEQFRPSAGLGLRFNF